MYVFNRLAMYSANDENFSSLSKSIGDISNKFAHSFVLIK